MVGELRRDQFSGLLFRLEDLDAEALAVRTLPEEALQQALLVREELLREDLEFVQVELGDLAIADYCTDSDVDGLLWGEGVLVGAHDVVERGCAFYLETNDVLLGWVCDL